MSEKKARAVLDDAIRVRAAALEERKGARDRQFERVEEVRREVQSILVDIGKIVDDRAVYSSDFASADSAGCAQEAVDMLDLLRDQETALHVAFARLSSGWNELYDQAEALVEIGRQQGEERLWSGQIAKLNRRVDEARANLQPYEVSRGRLLFAYDAAATDLAEAEESMGFAVHGVRVCAGKLLSAQLAGVAEAEGPLAAEYSGLVSRQGECQNKLRGAVDLFRAAEKALREGAPEVVGGWEIVNAGPFCSQDQRVDTEDGLVHPLLARLTKAAAESAVSALTLAEAE